MHVASDTTKEFEPCKIIDGFPRQALEVQFKVANIIERVVATIDKESGHGIQVICEKTDSSV